VQETQKRYMNKLKEENPEKLKEYRKQANQRYYEKKKLEKQNAKNEE
jgi:hypothetical protein